MRWPLLAGALLLVAGPAWAFCPSPNPNLLGPGHFVDDCPLPAAGLNKAAPLAAPNFTGPITVPGGGFTYSNRVATMVNRLSDRLFVGQAAALNNGGLAPQGDWLSQMPGMESTAAFSQMFLLATTGANGITAAARSSDNIAGAMQSTIPLIGICNNDLVGQGNCWAGYFESRKQAGNTGFTQGIEIDIGNYGQIVDVTPLVPTPGSATLALWVASGGTATPTNPASVAIGIVNNGQKFRRGLVVLTNALDASLGSGGNGIAMDLATGQSIHWTKADGTTLGEIWADLTGFHIKAPSGTVTNFP